MKRKGRPPIGEQRMTNSEKQARYRARQRTILAAGKAALEEARPRTIRAQAASGHPGIRYIFNDPKPLPAQPAGQGGGVTLHNGELKSAGIQGILQRVANDLRTAIDNSQDPRPRLSEALRLVAMDMKGEPDGEADTGQVLRSMRPVGSEVSADK